MLVDLFKCLTIPLCLIVIVYGDLTPSITYITQTQTQDVGRTLDLVCAVEHAQEYPVLWVKYDKLEETESIPLSNNYTLITRDPRISLRFDSVSTSYTLTIKDLEESDAGWYQCQIIRTGNSNITADVELQIRTRAVFINNSTRSLVASEGESAQLECYATGVPPPTVYWRRENSAMLPTGAAIYRGNILNFPSIQKEHRGTYYCVAENHGFKGVRRLLDVHVQYAPVINITRPQVEPIPGESTYLTCNIEAYPPPAITWFKDETPLLRNQRFRISNFATSDDFVSSSVRVDDIDESLYGNYTCKAHNKLGSAKGFVELIEPIAPTCLHPCNQTDIKTTLSPSTVDTV